MEINCLNINFVGLNLDVEFISSKTVVEASRTDPVHDWSDLVLRKVELHTKLPTTKMD